jgi:LysR substrate binding domain
MPDSPFVDAFRAIGLDAPAARVLVYSLPLRASLLATGEFITLVPGSVLRFGGGHMSFKVLPVQLPDWKLPVAIITLKNRDLSPVAKAFIECARDVVKPLVKFPSDLVASQLCVSRVQRMGVRIWGAYPKALQNDAVRTLNSPGDCHIVGYG